MMVTRTITLEELPRQLRLIPSSLHQSADHALMLQRVLDFARAFCPVETGALRDSIKVKRTSTLTAALMAGGGKVDYARHVHDGTINTPARPFLEQAIMAEKMGIGDKILRGALP